MRGAWHLSQVSAQTGTRRGPRGNGKGAAWAWEVLGQAGLRREGAMTLALMALPRFLGFWFNPVSFWLVLRGDDLLAVIAGVNNTFGQRHSYLCHRPGFMPIDREDRTRAVKVFHVSPFQDVAGQYEFRFDVTRDHICVMISYSNGAEGLFAGMEATPRSLRQSGLLEAAFRRPGGAAADPRSDLLAGAAPAPQRRRLPPPAPCAP